jgi:hypothetical protein
VKVTRLGRLRGSRAKESVERDFVVLKASLKGKKGDFWGTK